MPQTKTRKATTKKTRKAVKRPAPAAAARRLPRHRQYGAMPIRVARRDQLQVLLLTSRGTGRWVIPKGWRMRNRTQAATARREAFEEAGVKGQLWSRKPVGSYRYMKRDEKFTGEILVQVFILVVEIQKKDWPERGERRARWFSLANAASKVTEPGLAKLLRAIPNILLSHKPSPSRKKS